VIIGWILVGTQYRYNTIEEALCADLAYQTLEAPLSTSQDQNGQPKLIFSKPADQLGILARSGLNPQPRTDQTVNGGFEVPPEDHLYCPEWLGCDIRGDERHSGPIFNYAKVFTWWQFSHTVSEALTAMLENIRAGKACRLIEPGTRASLRGRDIRRRRQLLRDWDPQGSLAENLAGDSVETANYCGLRGGSIPAYPTTLPSEVWKRVFLAAVVALFVQWGTTGPSLFISYLTPTKGLGCRSTSYLLYGVSGTFVWLLLFISMLLSHYAMLRYQQIQIQHPPVDLSRNEDGLPCTYKRGATHTAMCAGAVITRYTAKAIAIANTLLLIGSNLAEITGGFDNCWCNSDFLSLGEDGWIVLFRSPHQIAAQMRLPLNMGIATIILVCFISWLFFYLGCKQPGDAD
jgi:hypothetical protein